MLKKMKAPTNTRSVFVLSDERGECAATFRIGRGALSHFTGGTSVLSVQRESLVEFTELLLHRAVGIRIGGTAVVVAGHAVSRRNRDFGGRWPVRDS